MNCNQKSRISTKTELANTNKNILEKFPLRDPTQFTPNERKTLKIVSTNDTLSIKSPQKSPIISIPKHKHSGSLLYYVQNDLTNTPKKLDTNQETLLGTKNGIRCRTLGNLFSGEKNLKKNPFVM